MLNLPFRLPGRRKSGLKSLATANRPWVGAVSVDDRAFVLRFVGEGQRRTRWSNTSRPIIEGRALCVEPGQQGGDDQVARRRAQAAAGYMAEQSYAGRRRSQRRTAMTPRTRKMDIEGFKKRG